MYTRKTFIALAVLVVAGAAAFLLSRPKSQLDSASAAKAVLFPGFDKNQAAGIKIKSKSGEVQLVKKNDSWFVAEQGKEFPADAKAITELFTKIEQLVTDEVVSEKAENHALFQVDAQGADVTVTKADNSELAHFIVGKNGPDFFSTYVRKQGSDQVYLIAQFIKSSFEKTAANWKERTLLNVEKDQVTKFSISGKERPTLTIAKQGEEWLIKEPKEEKADLKAVERIVNGFRMFTAADYAEETDPAVTGLDAPLLTVTVFTNEGKELKVLFGKEKEGKGYYTARGGDSWVFITPKFRYTSLNKTADDLKFKEEGSAPADKAEAASAKPAAGAPEAKPAVKPAEKKPDAKPAAKAPDKKPAPAKKK